MKYRIQIQQIFGGNWTNMEEATQHAEWMEKDNIKPRSRVAALEALETQMALYENGAPHRVVAYYPDGTFEVIYTLSRGTPWFTPAAEAETKGPEQEAMQTHIEQDGEVKYVTHFNMGVGGILTIVSGVFLCGELVASNSALYTGSRSYSQ